MTLMMSAKYIPQGLKTLQSSVGNLMDKHRRRPKRAEELNQYSKGSKETGSARTTELLKLEIGQKHPQTGNIILARQHVDSQSKYSNADFIVEGTKPSTKGKLIEEVFHYYENNGHHDPRVPKKGGDNLKKSVLPENHIDLFNSSIVFPGNGRRYAVDETGGIHQFQDSLNNTFHWACSLNGVDVKGQPNSLVISTEVRRFLFEQGLLQR